MKKMMMAVVGVALAVALAGCKKSSEGDEQKKDDAAASVDSAKSVAEEYAEALCRRDMDKVMSLMDTTAMTEKQITKVQYWLEESIKDTDLNDDKLSAKAFNEVIDVPSELRGYQIKNGKKYTGETAKVVVRCVKNKDEKSFGLSVELTKVDGKWKVTDQDMISFDDDDEPMKYRKRDKVYYGKDKGYYDKKTAADKAPDYRYERKDEKKAEAAKPAAPMAPAPAPAPAPASAPAW